MRRVHRYLAAAAMALGLLASACSVAFAAPSPPAPRIVTLTPRIIDLQPRIVDIRPKKSKKTYTVDADVLFAFNSAKLAPSAAQVLDDVVATLDELDASRVTIIGYTDSIGSTSYNQGLSERRAASVRAYLTENVTNTNLSYRSRGRGERNPVAANKKPDGTDNPSGRRKNRRVTIAYT